MSSIPDLSRYPNARIVVQSLPLQSYRELENLASQDHSLTAEGINKLVQAAFKGANDGQEGLTRFASFLKTPEKIYAIVNPEPTHSTERSKGGLPNLGTTCWLNSSLHFLFRQNGPYFEALIAKRTDPSIEGERCQNLFALLLLANQEPTPANNQKLQEDIEAFVTDLFKHSYLDDPNRQHDPHEGIDAILSYLGLIGEDTQIHKNGVFYTTRQMGEKSSKTSTKSIKEPVYVLRHYEKTKATSIQQLIDRLSMRMEELDKDNWLRFDGENEKEPTLQTNYFTLKGAPLEHFTFQVPRFIYTRDERSGIRREKDISPMTFDTLINVPVYDEQGEVLKRHIRYHLQSVVCHRNTGRTMDSGHYVYYERQADGSYIEINDRIVRIVSEQEAQEAFKVGGYFANYTINAPRAQTRIAPPPLTYESDDSDDEVLDLGNRSPVWYPSNSGSLGSASSKATLSPDKPSLTTHGNFGHQGLSTPVRSRIVSPAASQSSVDEEESFVTPPSSPVLNSEQQQPAKPNLFSRSLTAVKAALSNLVPTRSMPTPMPPVQKLDILASKEKPSAFQPMGKGLAKPHPKPVASIVKPAEKPDVLGPFERSPEDKKLELDLNDIFNELDAL